MNIELHSEILKIKAILNKINDTSYAYSQLSKRFPYQNATTEKELQDIFNAYNNLIIDLVNYLQTTNYGKKTDNK
ncbi:MAG: hypothetical protein AABY22_36175 [Nanoarchaeota archaeon]